MYSDIVLKHFKNPMNVGEIPDAQGIGIGEEPQAGNILKIWIKVDKKKITKITFKSNGCVPIIAAGSIITHIAHRKTLEKALRIKSRNVIKALGGLPKSKHHCADLAVDALRKAIQNYFDKYTDSVRV